MRSGKWDSPHLVEGGFNTKCILLIYLDEQALSESERLEYYAESTELAHQIHSNGQYLAANALQATAMATSVRVRKGTVEVQAVIDISGWPTG